MLDAVIRRLQCRIKGDSIIEMRGGFMRELSLDECSIVAGGSQNSDDQDSSYYGTGGSGGDPTTGGGGSGGTGGGTGTQTSDGSPAAWNALAAQLQAFFDDFSNDISTHGGSDQNSGYDDGSDAAPIDVGFLQEFGGPTAADRNPGAHYWDFLTRDIDPEFKAIAWAPGELSADFSQGRMQVSSTGNDAASFDLNGMHLVGTFHPGTPTHNGPIDPNTGLPDLIVTGGHWTYSLDSSFYPNAAIVGVAGSAASSHAITTPGGVSISFDKDLTQGQLNVLQKIADYGKAHHASNSQIWNAIQQAYHESKLGADWGGSDETKDGVHFGLLQYDTSSFARWGGGGNILDIDDQIAALFNEFTSFTLDRYNAGVGSGAIPTGFSYDEYLEYKHHQPSGDGGVTVGTAWTTYQATYDRDSYTGPEALKLHKVQQ